MIVLVPHYDISQIRIGTCLPGPFAEQWGPHMADIGFETLSVNFHMEYNGVNIEEQGPRMKAMAEEKGIEITTLGYYCNAIQYEEHKKNLERAIDAAHLYGAKTVSTFAGAYEGKPVDESFKKFGEVFRDLAKRAEDRGVRLAIENCPMGGTWQKNTCNIGFNPRAWDMMFDAVPSPALGLEWEPAHQMCQLIDPVANLRQYVGRVYHLHGKDASIHWDAIARAGILGAVNFVDSRFPGFGDTDWRKIFAILQENGYDGAISVEGYHDPYYSHDWEMTGQLHAMRYLKWCRGGDFTPNPW